MPNAMFAATPPRRTTRSSTRNDRDTLCNWSGRSCSLNRPGKCIRWSVAIEPVTTIFMAASVRSGGYTAWTAYPQRRAGGRTVKDATARARSGRESVEGVAAGAGARGVRVVDGEALCVDPVGEVDRRAG